MWLQLLIATLQIAGGILGYLKDRQQIEAGKAEQIKENLDASKAILGTLNKARSDAVAKSDASGGVPDPKDPYLRD